MRNRINGNENSKIEKHIIIVNETFNNECENNIAFCKDWIQIKIDN